MTWVRNGTDVMAQLFRADNSAATGEFLVPSNGYSGLAPDVAMAQDGTFIITWNGGDIDYRDGIQARMYDANGSPLAAQFRVNTLASATYHLPAIAVRNDKSFVIVWMKYGDYTLGNCIYGQRFNAAGAKVGTASFMVSTTTGNYKSDPDVDIADNGNFVVVWNADNEASSGTPYSTSIWGQRFNAAGTKQGGQFEIETTYSSMLGESLLPRVSLSTAGAFVIAWQNFPDASGWGIWARRYNSAGAAQGNDFRVNTHTANWQVTPDVACDRDGNFTIVWSSYNNPDDPITADYGIIARSFNAAGTATTGEYCVNNPGLAHRGIGDQIRPAACRKAGDGSWVTAWEGKQGVAPDGGLTGVWHSRTAGNPLPPLAWSLSSPISGSYARGTVIPIYWWATGVQAGYTVCLCYTTSPNASDPHWITIGQIVATNGASGWGWDTTGAIPGTYYIGGYIWNGSAPTYAWGASTFILT